MGTPFQNATPARGMRSQAAGYLPIENYGIIGNMRTCALAGMDGSIDFMCWPDFDSPSVFCRLLDKDKGGHFSIAPPADIPCTTKQQYLPSSNILQTRYIHESGVVDLVDFFPRPRQSAVITKGPKQNAFREMTKVPDELKKWLVRRVECIRGHLALGMLPALFSPSSLSLPVHPNPEIQISRSFRRLATPRSLTSPRSSSQPRANSART